ncbi:MAG: hypothetical protein ACE5GW_04855, partial [Planctomycetota bacterium]
SRKHRSKLKSASERVAGLHERGEEIAERLEEESARVFAYVMRDILEDVDEVRESLKPRYDPGELTQLLEQETISRLGKLKDALEEELRRRRQQQQQPQDQQPQQPGRPRMVPPVAELLMLKRMQVEILERTRSLNRARERDGELNPFQERILDRLALRQGSVLELTEKIASDFESAVGPGATGSGDGGQEGEEGSGEEGDGGEE